MKKLHTILLIGFILLAVILNFLPRLDYNYPIHVDEYVHIQYGNHLSGGAPLYFGGEYNSLEAGFHYLIATLNSIGVPYLTMFQFFASIITILICLGVFILARRLFNERAGVYAVLFIAVLKSTTMILGPMFFVPMAIGMFFIAMILFLIEIGSKAWILFLAGILMIHPPTATAILLLINIRFIFLKKNYIKNLGYQAIAGLIALPMYIPHFISKGVETINSLSFTPIVSALFIPRFLTYFVILIVIAGIYFTAEKKKYSIITYAISLLIFIFIFYKFRIEVFIPYPRALMYLFVVFALLFGYGSSELIKLSKNKKIQAVILILIIALTLIFALPSKITSTKEHFQIMDDKDYQAFNYIKENTLENSIILADPWKANAITPFAERVVYTRIVQGPNEESEIKNQESYDFFKNNCEDINFLVNNQINVVYGECGNSSLEMVYENVYFLR